MLRVLVAVLLSYHATAMSDTWRCPGNKGRPVYQDHPCVDAFYGNGNPVKNTVSVIPPEEIKVRTVANTDATQKDVGKPEETKPVEKQKPKTASNESQTFQNDENGKLIAAITEQAEVAPSAIRNRNRK